MCNDISQAKREHLEGKIFQRNQRNDSILDQLGLTESHDAVDLPEDTKEEVTLEDKPSTCLACKGKGKVKPMFFEFECDSCKGTGYDISDPIAIIKWQKLCMEWARAEVHNAKAELYRATRTENEIIADAVQSFYSNSRVNKHD